MPVLLLHGARQAVIVWKMFRDGLASALSNVIEPPRRTTGGRPGIPDSDMEPCP